MQFIKDKKTNLFIVLSGIFLTNALVAELIGAKIFSLENTLGFAPAQIPLLNGNVLDFNLTAGVVLWPVVFITTDIINEYFGKQGVRKISYLTVAFISYTFFVVFIATKLQPAQFWLDVNNTDAQGKPFDINYSFAKVYTQGLGIIFASIIAFLIAQFLDVFVFHKLRHITGKKMIWLRATGSTLISQLIDSFVVLGVAFYLLGDWSLSQVISVGIINYIYKFAIAIILTPLLYVAHNLIDRYLGYDASERLMEEAASDTSLF